MDDRTIRFPKNTFYGKLQVIKVTKNLKCFQSRMKERNLE